MTARAAATALALTVTLGVGWYFFNPFIEDEEDDEEEEPTIPREQILEIFQELKKQMPQKMKQVVQQLEGLRAQYPNIPQEKLSEIRKYCVEPRGWLWLPPPIAASMYADWLHDKSKCAH